MYSKLKLPAAIALSFLSSLSFADNLKFNTTEIDSFTGGTVNPVLNLRNVSNVMIDAGDTDEFFDGMPTQIDRIEITFPDANNLVVSNLKKVGPFDYRGTVKDAWIYRSVTANVHFPEGLYSHSRYDINVHMDLNESFTDSSSSHSSDQMLVDVFGRLDLDQDRTLADTVSFDHEGKPLTVSVYRDLKTNEAGELKIDVNINWQGHGVENVEAFAQLPKEEQHNMKVVGVRVGNEQSPQPEIIYVLKDKNGMQLELIKTLSWLKSEANF